MIISGTPYLIEDNDIAYLESSKKMVGKYDRASNTIWQFDDDEESDGEASNDECPVLSDESDVE